MRILVADDHGIVRSGIKLLLERQADLQVVAEASDGVEAVEQALATHPDLCILDVGMPRKTGLQAAREIRSFLGETRVLMLSMHDDEHYLFEECHNTTTTTPPPPPPPKKKKKHGHE